MYRFLSQYLPKKLLWTIRTRVPKVSEWYVQHFPAVNLKHKMDVWDYACNFSSELLVVAIIIVIAVSQLVIFNPLKETYTHNDQSMAAYFLQYHSDLNSQLAAKQNSINTTIAGHGGLINRALADNELLAASDEAEPLDEFGEIDEVALIKKNPDSVQKLVSRQVQIYETKPFDTVYTVAKQFNVTPKTIRETNGLPDNALKAGWSLIIPQKDGLVLKITNPNITLQDIAKKYSAKVEDIMLANALEGEEDMVDLGDYLIVPNGSLPTPPTPKPNKPGTGDGTKPVTPSIPKASVTGNHIFALGHCTDYVSRKLPGKIPWGGNANQWMANSKAYGATVDRNPVAGAILVTNESRYGHVVYIEKVIGDDVYISEWNLHKRFALTERVISIDDKRVKGVIHPK